MKNSQNMGFTILEVSTVLLVIALLVAGIVSGQAIVESSKTRSLINQIQTYDNGLLVFKDRYNYYPGDGIEATNNFFFSNNSIVPSDPLNHGDGDGVYGSTTPFRESCLAYYYMGNLGLYTGVYNSSCGAIVLGTNIPLIEADRSSSYGIAPVELRWVIGFDGSANILTTPFTPKQAYSYDSKVDDGKPLSGLVRAVAAGLANPLNTDYTVTPGCTSTGATTDEIEREYQMKSGSKLCGLTHSFTTAQ